MEWGFTDSWECFRWVGNNLKSRLRRWPSLAVATIRIWPFLDDPISGITPSGSTNGQRTPPVFVSRSRFSACPFTRSSPVLNLKTGFSSTVSWHDFSTLFLSEELNERTGVGTGWTGQPEHVVQVVTSWPPQFGSLQPFRARLHRLSSLLALRLLLLLVDVVRYNSYTRFYRLGFLSVDLCRCIRMNLSYIFHLILWRTSRVTWLEIFRINSLMKSYKSKNRWKNIWRKKRSLDRFLFSKLSASQNGCSIKSAKIFHFRKFEMVIHSISRRSY